MRYCRCADHEPSYSGGLCDVCGGLNPDYVTVRRADLRHVMFAADNRSMLNPDCETCARVRAAIADDQQEQG